MIEILQNLWGGCLQMFTLYNLAIIMLGSMVGTVVGALPGLGPSAGLALMIPLTFTMKADAGLALLVGVYMGCMFGGRITAILINTPGDAPAIMTCQDGYPLMCQGRGGFAMGLSAISSFVGGAFGLLVLIFMAPVITPLVKAIETETMSRHPVRRATSGLKSRGTSAKRKATPETRIMILLPFGAVYTVSTVWKGEKSPCRR